MLSNRCRFTFVHRPIRGAILLNLCAQCPRAYSRTGRLPAPLRHPWLASHRQGFVAISLFSPLIFKSLIRKVFDFEPRTLGEHIKKRRLMKGLYQQQPAERLGVDEKTVTNWEKGHMRPVLRLRPRIVEFPGYDPDPPVAETIEQKLRAKRHALGFSIEHMAPNLDVDPTALGYWERGGTIHFKRHRKRSRCVRGDNRSGARSRALCS